MTIDSFGVNRLRITPCMRRLVIRHLLLVAAHLLGVSSFVAPAFAYRTASDSPDFDGTASVRWSRDQVSFVINTDGEPSSVSGGVSGVVLDAVRQWNEPLCSSLELQPAGVTDNAVAPGDGVNTIAWVRDWEARGFSSDAPATTDVQYEREVTTNDDGEEDAGEWRIVEADVYLDARRRWTLLPVAPPSEADSASGDAAEAGESEQNASEEAFDLLSVLTHEFGHAAGLMHPCEVGGEDGAPDCRSTSKFDEVTMYPLYAPDQATLEEDDERGVCFLYKQDTCEQTGCETGFRCVDQRCEALCGSGTDAEVCELGETCVDGKCIEECTSFECLNPTCKRNKDCPATLRCDGHYCVPGLGELGDPCATPRDCSSQACSKNGVCLLSCTENTDCESEKCRAGLNGSRVCATPLNALGDECKESNECLGDQCVADAVETPVCTRRCGEGESDCPLDWTCDLVEGRAVCIPPAPAAKGCAVTPHGRSTSGTGAAAILFTLAAASGLRRRNRHRGKAC